LSLNQSAFYKLKIFKKSLSHELIATAGATFLILIGIMIAQRAGYLVRNAEKGLIPNDAIVTMLGFGIVKFLPIILSLTIFLAVLLTLTRWHRDSEMAVWFSSGLSMASWIRPILNFAIPVVVVILLLSFIVTPWATRKVEDYRVQLKGRDELSALSAGTFKESSSGDRIYFIESFDELGKIVKNIFVQSTQHQKTGVIVASEGNRFKAKNDDNFIVLKKGRRYEGKPNTAEVSNTEFESYAIRVETKEVTRGPDTTTAKPTHLLLGSQKNIDKAELQWRFSIPLSALVLVLLAVPLSFVDPRAGRSLNLMFAILIYMVYNNMLSIFQAWVTQGKLISWIGLWPVHLLFIMLGFYLYYRRIYLLPVIPRTLSDLWPTSWNKQS
jgi:lipopolysaccharide export system permease protein